MQHRKSLAIAVDDDEKFLQLCLLDPEFSKKFHAFVEMEHEKLMYRWSRVTDKVINDVRASTKRCFYCGGAHSVSECPNIKRRG